MNLFFKIIIFVVVVFQLIACNSDKIKDGSLAATSNETAVTNEFLQLNVHFNSDTIDDIVLDSLTYWSNGITVGNVMDSVHGKLNLTFKKFTGIGRLLIGIENITVTDSSFWYLCVNDTASDKGMDDKILKPGSSISWQFGAENPCYKNQFNF